MGIASHASCAAREVSHCIRLSLASNARLFRCRNGNQIITTVPELQSRCLADPDFLLKLCGDILGPDQQEEVSVPSVRMPESDQQILTVF